MRKNLEKKENKTFEDAYNIDKFTITRDQKRMSWNQRNRPAELELRGPLLSW